jgi:hypothetical protein
MSQLRDRSRDRLSQPWRRIDSPKREAILYALTISLFDLFKSRRRLQAENLFLRSGWNFRNGQWIFQPNVKA